MNGKKRKQAVRGRSGLPAWIWLGIGLLAGVALASFVFLNGYAPTLRDPDGPSPQSNAQPAPPGEQGIAAKADDDESYDFYTVLPEMEVVIPDDKLSAQADQESSQSSQPDSGAQAAADQASYVLQAGSFSDPAEADSLKARLTLLGFSAHVEAVTINGETWNRVRLGPYDSASALEAAKQKLGAQGINALALKVNG